MMAGRPLLQTLISLIAGPQAQIRGMNEANARPVAA
jgi:hypothetical protein